jgi:hypothetical protein
MFTVDPFNPNYASENGILFDKSTNALLVFPSSKAGDYTIPNGVTSIGDRAFANCYGLTNIVIPGSVTNIGDYAFYACINLTGVTMSNGVTSIGYAAFTGCPLGTLAIPDSVTSVGEWAFSATSLTNVILGNSLANIGDDAFYGCANLASVTIKTSAIDFDPSKV